MRIVDLPTFLALPPGTVFMKYDPCAFTDFGIREDTFCENGDFWYVDLASPHFKGERGSDDWSDTLDAMAAGASSPPLDLDTVGRDGLYEKGQMYAVFERHDVEALIARLGQCLAEGYPKDPTP